MEKIFEEPLFREFKFPKTSGNIIKNSNAEILGNIKITVEEETHNGVKIVLKKDENDNIKEIKFVCSCGETKSILLDYSE